jgi:ribosomal protein L11 methyltransferase
MTEGTSAPRGWRVLRVPKPTDPDQAALAVEVLLEAPTRGVEERDGELVAYLPDDAEDGDDALIEALSLRLAEVLGEVPRLTSVWQAHEAWEERWRQGLGPRRITSRLVVSPSWVEPELRPGELLVVVDPGMAFGTAEHPTTRGSLRLLDRLVEPGHRVADVGAGSGILSVAAARLGADEVVALEMDAWSCQVARENARGNGVEDRIQVRQLALTSRFLPEEPPFHGIVANIESGVLLPLLPGFAGGLEADGWLILSGIMADEAADLREAAFAEGLELMDEDREEEWWTASFRRRDPPG